MDGLLCRLGRRGGIAVLPHTNGPLEGAGVVSLCRYLATCHWRGAEWSALTPPVVCSSAAVRADNWPPTLRW